MSQLQESETNMRLGYPSDARLLIINADDFGMCYAINDAILRSLKDGVVCSTSVMVPCPDRDSPTFSPGASTQVCPPSSDFSRWTVNTWSLSTRFVSVAGVTPTGGDSSRGP